MSKKTQNLLERSPYPPYRVSTLTLELGILGIAQIIDHYQLVKVIKGLQKARDLAENIGCIIDAHAHLPVSALPHRYLERLADAGISHVVLLGLPNIQNVIARINLSEVRSEYKRSLGVIKRHVPQELWDVLRPESLYYITLELAERYGPLNGLLEDEALVQSLLGIIETGLGISIFHAPDLGKDPESIKKEIEDAYRRGARGVKIISTLFMKYLDDPSVEAAIEAAEELDIPVVVHAGCDPGIWELPRYCRFGDPSRLEPVLSRHREARIVIAHVGGYSAIAPGVFMSETISLLRRYPSVYADISALNPVLIEMSARDAPREKLIYGSDYPVIDRDPESFLLDTYKALVYAGYNQREIRRFFYENAEEILGIKCS